MSDCKGKVLARTDHQSIKDLQDRKSHPPSTSNKDDRGIYQQ